MAAEDELNVRALLFDRLVDHDPKLRREIVPVRTLNRRDLKESLRRELEKLLNTRCSIPARQLRDRPRTVVDYGIPDFSTFTPGSHRDRLRMAAQIADAIEAYEPRLLEVQVAIEPPGPGARTLRGRVTGILVTDSVREPVSFPLEIDGKEATAEVDESL